MDQEGRSLMGRAMKKECNGLVKHINIILELTNLKRINVGVDQLKDKYMGKV